MLSRLRKLFGKENRKPKESRERQKEGNLLPQCKRSRQKWSWGRHSDLWVRDGEIPEENGLELGLPRVGLRRGESEKYGTILLLWVPTEHIQC